MKKCIYCNSDIPSEAKFCPNCGYKLNAMSVEDKSKIQKIVFPLSV